MLYICPMKTIITFSTAALLFLFSACGNSSPKNESPAPAEAFKLDTTKLKSGDVFYQCEMDPSVISDKPGTCPTCGMDLEKKGKK
jgi:hypothetical protein